MAKANLSESVIDIDNDKIPQNCILVAEAEKDGMLADRAFYKKGKLKICPANDKIEVLTNDDIGVKIKAKTYIHAVEVLGEKEFEDNWFSLMPGEIREVKCCNASVGKTEISAYTIADIAE